MGTHPIFESDFDCLTECRLVPWCQFMVQTVNQPVKTSTFQLSSRLPSALMLSTKFILVGTKTIVNHTPLPITLVNKHPPNHGELVVPFPVFHVFAVVVPPDQVLPLSVICVEVVVCSIQIKLGEDGSER